MAYRFYYSLDESKNFNFLTETGPNKILSKGYTGAYCGLYSTTNGKEIQEHADYDWVMLK
jgi:alpha-N-arabinofuranosidase